jgi:hypothetical protein
MKKLILAALLVVSAAGQAMAATTYFTENFANLSAWTTRGANQSFASVSDNVLSFSQGNSAGDIYTTATFTGGFVNFDYLGASAVDGGGYVGFSEGLPGNHVWLAGSSTTYGTPTNLINDGTWHHYSLALTGTGHVMLEQFANNTPGQGQFRSLSVTDVAVAAVPEPETYAMLLAGLGMMGAIARRRKAKQA